MRIIKKIILVDGSYPINTRNMRIIKTLETEYDIKFCSWNRSKIITDDLNNYIYSSNEGYGNKLKKIFGMFKFFFYLKKILKENTTDIIIASQWDMLLLCKLLKKSNQILVYDNIDMPTNKNKMILKILKTIEKWCLKDVNGMIYASRFFKVNYAFEDKKELILENKPLKKLEKKIELDYKSEKIKISFIGTLRYYEILKKLILAVKKYENEVEVLMFGNGPEESKIKQLVKNNKQKNIIFFGKYDYYEIAKFYGISDVIWALYPCEDYNVKYAISNKFHESIVFEKTCIFSKDTLLGEYIKEKNIGISLDINQVEDFIEKLVEKKISLKSIEDSLKNYKKNNIDLFWEDEEQKIVEFIRGIE